MNVQIITFLNEISMSREGTPGIHTALTDPESPTAIMLQSGGRDLLPVPLYLWFASILETPS